MITQNDLEKLDLCIEATIDIVELQKLFPDLCEEIDLWLESLNDGYNFVSNGEVVYFDMCDLHDKYPKMVKLFSAKFPKTSSVRIYVYW